MAEEKVPLHDAAIAVAKREHSSAIKECVPAIDVFAGLVGDDLQFAIAAIEQVLFDDRRGVAHRLVAVADANRFAAIASQRWARAEMIMVDVMAIGHAFGLDLQSRRVVCLPRQVTTVHAMLGPREMDKEFEGAAHNGGVRQSASATGNLDAVSGRLPILQKQSADDEVFAVDEERRLARQEHFARGLGAQRDRLVRCTACAEDDSLILPWAVRHDEDVARTQFVRYARDFRRRRDAILGRDASDWQRGERKPTNYRGPKWFVFHSPSIGPASSKLRSACRPTSANDLTRKSQDLQDYKVTTGSGALDDSWAGGIIVLSHWLCFIYDSNSLPADRQDPGPAAQYLHPEPISNCQLDAPGVEGHD